MIFLMRPTDFRDWTREERIEFLTYQNNAFNPTDEEKEQSEAEALYNDIQIVKSMLSPYGITMTWEEEWEELIELWKLYMLGNGTEENQDMQEWLWEKNLLQQRFEERKHGNMRQFCNFVMQYES